VHAISKAAPPEERGQPRARCAALETGPHPGQPFLKKHQYSILVSESRHPFACRGVPFLLMLITDKPKIPHFVINLVNTY
jgi:hypothetical protein